MKNFLFPVAAIVLAGAVQAQTPLPVRGTVADVTASKIVLTKADGSAAEITLLPNWVVSVTKPIGIDAIKPGSFIGTAEMPQEDGTGRSLEVHIFPPGVKIGEGHYGWNLKEGSMMTNGTVGEVTATPDGRKIVVSYPGGERTITVPADVPIVEITNGTQDQLKTGIPAFLVAFPLPDGTQGTGAVAIGENGAAPPM